MRGRPQLSTQPVVRLARKHHLLVRVSHWLNVLLLAGLIVSGISIYWASPIYQHSTDPQTGNSDYFADAGVWLCAHVPGLHSYASPPDWIYNHFSLGPYMLAPAMRLHWCCAYLFMANALRVSRWPVLGGEWRRLLPRSGRWPRCTVYGQILSGRHPSLCSGAASASLPVSTPNTTHSSDSRIFQFPSPVSCLLSRAGRFTNPCSFPGLQRSSADSTGRGSGISG